MFLRFLDSYVYWFLLVLVFVSSFERGFDPNESSSSRTLPTLVVAPLLPSTPPSPSSLSPSCPGVGRRRAVPPLPSLSSLLSPSSPSSSSSLATAVWLHQGVHGRLQLCVWLHRRSPPVGMIHGGCLSFRLSQLLGCAPPGKPTCGPDPWRLSQLPALLRTRGTSSIHCSTNTADWSSRCTG